MKAPILVLGFIPDDLDIDRDGVHTPLRSDGYYSGPETPRALADFWAESRLDPRERITVVQVEFGRSTMVQRALVMGLPAGYGRAPFSHARNSRSEQRMTSRVLTLGSSGSGRRTIPMLSLEHKNGCAMPTGGCCDRLASACCS